MKRTLKRESKALEIVKSETNGGSNGCGRMSGVGARACFFQQGDDSVRVSANRAGNMETTRPALSIMRRLLVIF